MSKPNDIVTSRTVHIDRPDVQTIAFVVVRGRDWVSAFYDSPEESDQAATYSPPVSNDIRRRAG